MCDFHIKKNPTRLYFLNKLAWVMKSGYFTTTCNEKVSSWDKQNEPPLIPETVLHPKRIMAILCIL